jgi:hypothetical protein
MQQTMLDEPRTVAAVMDLEPKAPNLPAVAAQQAMAEASHPFRAVELAVERGMPVEVIEKLIAAAERMEAMRERERLRQAELAFRRGFADFKGENVIVPKTKTVNRAGAGSFDQAEFNMVCGLLAPPLSKHGFGFRHDEVFGSRKWSTDGVESDIPWVYVTCFLEHREGHAEKLDLEGPPADLQANTPVQNMQATASYLKRQSLLAITGTATAEEDNEERLVRKQEGSAKQSEFETLLGTGRAAAMGGTVELTAWWQRLNPQQRSLMNREFGKLRKDAAANDRPVDHSREQDQRGAQRAEQRHGQ